MARLVAATEHDNLPSRRVMERLGMRVETNPLPEKMSFFWSEKYGESSLFD